MKILGRHVSITVFGAMFGVLFLLLGLDLVFSFIGELEDLKGHYQAPQAFLYVLLELPWRLSDITPVASLVGAIVGLGLLANQSELTVMRAAGVGIGRIVWWAIRPALLMVAMAMLVAQFAVPYCEAIAETGKSRALGESYQPGLLRGFWQKEGGDFVHVRTVYPDGRLEGVSFFRLLPDGTLSGYRQAATGIHGDNGWRLDQVENLSIKPGGQAGLGRMDTVRWETGLTPGFLRLVTVSPEYLSMTSLYHYAGYLDAQGLVSRIYYLEFWKKVLSLPATLSMVLIACSFIFGPLRSVTMGLRIIAGVMAGLGFRYLQDFFGYASLVYHFSPLLAAALPVALCLAAGVYALSRIR